MRRPGLRDSWVKFQRGYGQIAAAVGAMELLLLIYADLVLTFYYLPKEYIALGLVGLGVIAALSVRAFGNWDYTGKRTFWKKTIRIECKNHPFLATETEWYITMSNAMNQLLEKNGIAERIDISIWDQWRNSDIVKE